MCAIFGWWKPEFPSKVKRDKLLRGLARKSQAYGNKSFGLAAIVAGKLQVSRYTGPASQWISQNEKDVSKWASADKLIGHTRLPTMGAVTKANCHPFEIGAWHAAHNGCISNSSKLMLKAETEAKGETDSEETLCYVVSKDWSPAALKEIDGSYAFEAIKADGSELVLVCDRARDLYTVRLGDGVVWCTSKEALASSLAGAGMSVANIEKLEEKLLRFKDGAREPEVVEVKQSFSQLSLLGRRHEAEPDWVSEHLREQEQEMID